MVLYRLLVFWYLSLAGELMHRVAIAQRGELVFLTPLLYFFWGEKL